jgi:hypothetical protein
MEKVMIEPVPPERKQVGPARAPRFRRVANSGQLMPRDLLFLKTVAQLGVAQSVHVERVHADVSAQNLRRRLRVLYDQGYLDRPKRQIAALLDPEGDNHFAYTLTAKGAKLLAPDGEGRFRSRQVSQLEHALRVSDFMVGVIEACHRSEHLEPILLDELLRAAPEATRKDRQPDSWPILVAHRGERRQLSVRPDAIFAVQSRKREAGRNRKFYYLEVDRSTMPVVRRELHQTSIVRKFLAYGATFEEGLHERRYGMSNMRALFVTKSRERADNLIAACQKHARGIPPRLFLFIDRPTLLASKGGLFEAQWRDGEGEERSLFA